MVASRKPQYFTLKEYLAMEAVSETKHGYFYGEIYAMAGASPNHNRISSSTIGSLIAQLAKRPCDVFGSDQRVRVSGVHYAYPDISIVCGKPEFDDKKPATLLNPTVLIEVLSSSTEDDDRRIKALHFRERETVQEYLLIAQDKIHIEHWVRDAEDAWRVKFTISQNAVLELQSINCTLALADMYAKVDFEDQAAS
jgi:Uma2 family endonuclease